jgi:hypothetical protein
VTAAKPSAPTSTEPDQFNHCTPGRTTGGTTPRPSVSFSRRATIGTGRIATSQNEEQKKQKKRKQEDRKEAIGRGWIFFVSSFALFFFLFVCP